MTCLASQSIYALLGLEHNIVLPDERSIVADLLVAGVSSAGRVLVEGSAPATRRRRVGQGASPKAERVFHISSFVDFSPEAEAPRGDISAALGAPLVWRWQKGKKSEGTEELGAFVVHGFEAVLPNTQSFSALGGSSPVQL